MRLNEIIDKSSMELLEQYYEIHGQADIDDNGYVHVNGDCSLANESVETNIIELPPIKFSQVSGYFSVAQSTIASLKGCPKKVGNGFYCFDTNITNLIGCPTDIYNEIDCRTTPLKSLEGISDTIHGNIDLPYTPTLPLLKLLFVKKLQRVRLLGSKEAMTVQAILNAYLDAGKGKGGVLQCAALLVKEGFKGNARM